MYYYAANLPEHSIREFLVNNEQLEWAEFHRMIILRFETEQELVDNVNGELVFDGLEWLVERPDLTLKEEMLPVITYPMWEKFVTPLRSMIEQTMQPAMKVVALSGTSAKAVNNDYQDFLEACDFIDQHIEQYKQENPDSWPEE